MKGTKFAELIVVLSVSSLLCCFACDLSLYKRKSAFALPDSETASKLEQQPDVVNDLFVKQIPGFSSLSRDERLREIHSKGFRFLNGQPAKDFPSLFSVAVGPFSSTELPPNVLNDVWWKTDSSSSAQYYYVRTNIWKLVDSLGMSDIPYTDELIITVVDGLILSHEVRPVIPY